MIKVSRLIFGDFIFKFYYNEVFTWVSYRIASLLITVESVLTSVRYKSHMKYIVPMWTKDLSGNLWRYGSYHVHVFLRFSVSVSHTQNRPTTLVLLILSLTGFLDLGTYENILFGITFGPKKYLKKNLATKPILSFCK